MTRRLPRVELDKRIRAKARKLQLYQRPRTQRLTKARKLFLRQRSPSLAEVLFNPLENLLRC